MQALARLFSKAAVHLGSAATEERAKAIGKGVRYVHFASHGLIDEHLPLESALALSAPATPDEGCDNGRLHAWEIIERVRLDADLVTLAACRSAVGTELAGEGLIGLTRALAKEVASRGVTVNLVAPGFIETDMTAGLPDATKAAYRAQIPLGRFGTAAEVAAAVAFLASDAAAYITGQVIHINGGMWSS